MATVASRMLQARISMEIAVVVKLLQKKIKRFLKKREINFDLAKN